MNEIITSIDHGSIACNFEEIKNHLEGELQLYKGMIFTEDTKKDAKNTVAELRKEKEAFNKRVKELKAEYMKPYEAFYAKACEISDLYDEPIAFIGGQIEAFEAQRIEAKKQEIKAIYTELVPEEDMIDLIPLQRIYNPKWENATFTAKQIREEIMNRKISGKEAIETIRSMGSEREAQAIEMYKRDFDLSSCIVYLNNYERQKSEIMAKEQERIQREAEERIRAEERAKIEAEMKAESEKAQAVEEAKAQLLDAFIPVYDEVDPEEYSYIIKLTPSEKEALETYMNSIGITFEILAI